VEVPSRKVVCWRLAVVVVAAAVGVAVAAVDSKTYSSFEPPVGCNKDERLRRELWSDGR
jgi:hypothetical protein